MKKIISLFQRNYEGDRLVRNEVVPGAEWVLAGEGVATRKYNGTACRIHAGILYKRYDVKPGKTPPHGAEPCQDPDPLTGHWPHWVPIGDGSEDQWYREARHDGLPDGTYELCGPKINGNPEQFARHTLIRHGQTVIEEVPRDYAGLQAWFVDKTIEGIVWHHPDGRMVKIKKRDFPNIYAYQQEGN